MKLMQVGTKGNNEKAWQKFLNKFYADKIGYVKLVEDGNFGKKTEAISKNFQSDNGLEVDGLIGKNTILKAVEFGFNKPSEFTRDIHEIILHITANGNGLTGQALREYLVKVHKGNGWSDIGYHWIVDKDGNVIKGRDENIIGSHCKAQGKNNGTIGIAYDSRGNDKTPYAVYGIYFQSPEQKESFERLVKEKMIEFNIDIENVHGHNFYDKGKACPCFNVEQDREFKKAML